MKLLAYFRSLTAKFLHSSQTEDDIEEELRTHVQNRADDLQRSGLDRAEAERRASIEFGGHVRFKEESREALGGNFVDTLIRDARFSLRVLRKSPGFTAVAVLTLALAIGANAIVFGVANGLILRPLNVPQAETLYAIEHGKESSMQESYPDYLDLRDRNRSFDALAAFSVDQVGLDAGETPTRAWVESVSGNYFDALKIQPYLGRVFHSSDEHGANSAPYIVLTYAYWQTHFQEDRNIVGRSVRVNKHPFTIIGVAPPDFRGTIVFFAADFFAPLVNQEMLEGKNNLDARRDAHSVFMTLGHLKPGVTLEQAAADLNSVGAYLDKTYPADHGAVTFKLARPSLAGNFLGGPILAFVKGLTLLSGLILLAACANLGSLFAARAADRSREVALRLALGASRSRIMRQLLTEAVMISLAGGALGLWGSVVLLRLLSVWQPLPRFPINIPVTPDANVYAIALVLALVSALLFGIVPIRQVLRADPYQIIKAGSSAMVGRRVTVRDVLLAGQIAICAVLVTASFVAVRGLARSLNSNFGFDPTNTMLVETDLYRSGYRDDKVPEMQKRMIETMEAIPGVKSVGVVNRPPLAEGAIGALVYTDQTTDLRTSNAVTNALRYNITPGYFDAAGTHLLTGRVFSWHDDKTAPRVAVVNREFAKKLFGSETNAVGGYYKIQDGTRIQVVGIVEDGKYVNLTEERRAAAFVPIQQTPASETWLVVRSTRDPLQLGPALHAAVRGLDRGLPFFIQTWDQELNSALFPSRVATVALGVLGMMGAMLAITGVFGMAAYAVSKRLREIGLRLALGARRSEVLQTALGRALKLLAFGSAAGIVLGILAARILSSVVYQATPRDPVVLSGVVIAMMLLGLLSTWVPAQRALSVDPLKLLRDE
jgi:predicted permease